MINARPQPQNSTIEHHAAVPIVWSVRIIQIADANGIDTRSILRMFVEAPGHFAVPAGRLMKKGKILILGLLAVSILTFARTIIFKRPGTRPVLITASALRRTQSAWTNQTYTLIDTSAEFESKIEHLPLLENDVRLTESEAAALRRASVDLILANYLGDYSQFLKFRLPAPNFDPPSEAAKKGWGKWFRAAFPGEPVPAAFDQITEKIWNKIYGDRHYWLSIGLDKSYISLLATNQVVAALPMDMVDPDNSRCMESISRGTYSYDSTMTRILMENHELKLARINVWADTMDPVNTPRPFMYLMVLDPGSNSWLPIEVAQCATTGGKYPVPF